MSRLSRGEHPMCALCHSVGREGHAFQPPGKRGTNSLEAQHLSVNCPFTISA